MNMADLIFRLIPLLLFLIIMMNPLLKKFIKKKLGENPKQDKSPVKNLIFENPEPAVSAALPHSYPSPEKVKKILSQGNVSDDKPRSSVEKLDKLPDLKKAVVWSEILSTPVGLRD